VPGASEQADELVEHWLTGTKTSVPFRFPKVIEGESAIMNGEEVAAALLSASASAHPSVGKFAFLAGDKTLADVELVVRCLRGAAGSEDGHDRNLNNDGSDEDSEAVLDSQPLHSTVLCANSTYFRSKLLGPQPGACPPPQLPVSPDGLKMLDEVLAPADVAPLLAVLRFMYTEVLDYRHGVSSPAELVNILRIADRYQVADCVAACRREFSKLKVEEIDLEIIKMVYSIDTIVKDASSFTEMMSAVQERLLGMFHDVVETIRSPALLSQFLQLPFAAAAAVLSSDTLVVDSENSVAVMATLWMVRGRGRACSPEQRKFISSCIRLDHLSSSYLLGVLPNLRWYSFPQMSAALFYHTIQTRLAATPESKALLMQNAIPRGQAAPPNRNLRVLREQNLELMCEVEQHRLAQYISDAYEALVAVCAPPGGSPPGDSTLTLGFKGIHVHSECSFFKGYLFGIKIVFGSAGPQLRRRMSESSDSSTTSNSVQLVRVGSSKGSMAAVAAAATAAAAAAPAAPEVPFSVTPSVFASFPPGEEGMLPLTTPINVCFKCTLEALGPYGTPFATATFPGASFMRPGEESISSVAIANFFKKVGPRPHDPESWTPFLCGGKLRLRLVLHGASVE